MTAILARLRGGPGDHDRPLVSDCHHVAGHPEGHYAKGDPVADEERVEGVRGANLPQVWFDWVEGPCDYVEVKT